jgi:hypothetical protein
MPNLAIIETIRFTVYMSFEFLWKILLQELGMHVWWIWPTVLVENQPSGLFPVEEINQVIKMLSNYSTAAVTLLLALGVDKGLQLVYTEI